MGGVPAKKAASAIYQLKITLEDIRPAIWRRFHVPASIQLSGIHDAIQIVMGWRNSHLHQFEKDGKRYGVPEDDEFGNLGIIDESKLPVDQLLKRQGDSLPYVYDFGDDWRHELVLEKILPVEDATVGPVCLAGERHCPPEDVGGVQGYAEFLEAIFDPKHQEHDQCVRWARGRFQPEEFDLKAVNEASFEDEIAGSTAAINGRLCSTAGRLPPHVNSATRPVLQAFLGLLRLAFRRASLLLKWLLGALYFGRLVHLRWLQGDEKSIGTFWHISIHHARQQISRRIQARVETKSFWHISIHHARQQISRRIQACVETKSFRHTLRSPRRDSPLLQLGGQPELAPICARIIAT